MNTETKLTEREREIRFTGQLEALAVVTLTTALFWTLDKTQGPNFMGEPSWTGVIVGTVIGTGLLWWTQKRKIP